MPINFQNILQIDPCLKEDCTVCLNSITFKNGEAHAVSRRWWQGFCRRNPPTLYHAIHKTCQQEWFKTQLLNNLPASCPTCREPVQLPLKERVISKVEWIGEIAMDGIAAVAAIATAVSFCTLPVLAIIAGLQQS